MAMQTERDFTKPQAATNFTNANRMADFREREVSFVSFVAPKVLRVMFLLAAWKKFVSFVKFVVEKTSET